MTPAELETILRICRSFDVHTIEIGGVKIDLGPRRVHSAAVTADEKKKLPASQRPLTDAEALFAATDGIPDEDG